MKQTTTSIIDTTALADTGTTEQSRIYPVLLVTEELSEQQDHSYQQISCLKRQREDERENAHLWGKKYHREVNAIYGVDTALVSDSVSIDIGSAGPLCTIIAAQIVLGLECASLACGLLRAADKFISCCLAIKAKKHDEIRVLADSKLNTITDHVSTALIKGKISDQEFRLVLSEVFKYQQMKDVIWTWRKKLMPQWY